MGDLLECICGILGGLGDVASCCDGCSSCNCNCGGSKAKGTAGKGATGSTGKAQFTIARCGCGYDLSLVKGMICPQCEVALSSGSR